MKSTNNERKPFSMEDFEKGLMLAGLISPSSIKELNERMELEKYEKELKKENKDIFFKRVVLAAEIVYQLHEEPTFGRIKFQKLVYLCEHVAEMNLEERYAEQVAGPFDNKFMHSIIKQFKANKWFKVEIVNSGKMNRSKYIPLENVEKYKSFYNSYFGHQANAIQKIIDLFRRIDTPTTEIAATLYACQRRLRSKSDAVSYSDLVEKFYSWSEEKKRFDSDKVKSVWKWMVSKGLVVDLG